MVVGVEAGVVVVVVVMIVIVIVVEIIYMSMTILNRYYNYHTLFVDDIFQIDENIVIIIGNICG